LEYKKHHEEPSTLLEYHKGLAMAYRALVDVLVKTKVITLEEVTTRLDTYISLFEEGDPAAFEDIIFSIGAVKKMLQVQSPDEGSSPETSRTWLASFSGEA